MSSSEDIVEIPPGPPAWRGWTRDMRVEYLRKQMALRDSRFAFRRRRAHAACLELLEYHEAELEAHPTV